MYWYQIHSFATVASELALFPPSLQCGPKPKADVSFRFEDSCKYYEDRLHHAVEVMPGVFFCESHDTIITRLRLLGCALYLSIKGFGTDSLQVVFNQKYVFFSRKIVRLPLSSFFPLEHFLKLVLNAYLSRKGISMLLAAGMRYSDKNILLSAFGGIGKTTTCLNLMRSPNSLFLADDTVLLHEGRAHSYPQKIRIRKIGGAFAAYEKYKNPAELFEGRMVDSFVPNVCFLLERSVTNKVVSVDPASCRNRLAAITHKVLPLNFERILGALTYVYQPDPAPPTVLGDALNRIPDMKCCVLQGDGPFWEQSVINNCGT